MIKSGRSLSLWSHIDWILVGAVLLLVSFGLSAVYSVALGQAQGEFANFQKQLIWLLLGVSLMFAVAHIDYHRWQRFGWIFYGLSLALLLLVLTPLGSTIRGTRGWFALGPANFQPVELVKIFLIVVLADAASRYSRTIHRLTQMVVVGLIVAVPFALVMLQPDFGSGMILFFTWSALFMLLVRKKWHIALVIVSLVVLFGGAWQFAFQDYQKERVLTFVDPGRDPLGRGYNVRQSMIAVGAGGLVGRGLGFGSQSQLKFIPESQTDFIFAVVAEELGLAGVTVLLGLFATVLYRMYRIAVRAPDDFGLFLVLLTAALLFVQIFINIGMCMGLLPVTGISLPLVSYGGSFLMTVLFLMGLVLNVGKMTRLAGEGSHDRNG